MIGDAMTNAARLYGVRAGLLNMLRVEEEANKHPTKLENLIRYALEEATEQHHRALREDVGHGA